MKGQLQATEREVLELLADSANSGLKRKPSDELGQVG